MSTIIKTEQVQNRQVIGTSDLVYCNTKYHTPYLAKLDSQAEMDWQDKIYVGFGKNREAYYSVDKLQAGDIISAAGGSGGNKYPYRGRVVALNADSIEVESLSEKEYGNIIAERRAKPVIESPLAKFSIDELLAELNCRGINVQESVQAR